MTEIEENNSINSINLWEVPMLEATYAIKLQACYIDLTWEYIYIYTDVQDYLSIDMDYVRKWAYINDMFYNPITLEALWIYGIVPAGEAFLEQNPDMLDEDDDDSFSEELDTEQDLINFRDKVEDITSVSKFFLPASEMMESV